MDLRCAIVAPALLPQEARTDWTLALPPSLYGLAFLTVALALSAPLARSRGIRSDANPAIYLIAPWLLVLAINTWNPLGWVPPSIQAIVVVAVGVTCLMGGFLLVLFSQPRLSMQWSSRVESDVVLRRACTCCLAAGTVLFTIYLAQVAQAFGLGANTLIEIRDSLATDESGVVGFGFYFFYPMQLGAALAAASYRLTGDRRYLVATVVAAGTLVLTSGRTNILTTVIWISLVLVLTGRPLRPRRLLQALSAAVTALMIAFIGLGNAVGKTWDNNPLSEIYGADSPLPSALVSPVQYFCAPLAALSVQLELGKVTDIGAFLVPISGTLWPLLGLQKPEEIQDYVEIPFPFNLYTMWGPFISSLDLGAFALTQLAIGALFGGCFTWWVRTRSVFAVTTWALLLYVLVSSPTDNWLNRKFVPIYTGALVVLYLIDRSRKARVDALGNSTASRAERSIEA